MTDVNAPSETAADEVADAAPAEPERLHGALVTTSGRQTVLHASRDELVELVRALRDDGYWMCIDLCAVDYLAFRCPRGLPEGVDAERFEVVVNLLDHTSHRRVRIRVQVPEDDPRVPSLFALHPGTEAMEREAFDMFGIEFTDHPDLSRILMPDSWIGHPLRKDYSVGAVPVQFKGAPTTGWGGS